MEDKHEQKVDIIKLLEEHGCRFYHSDRNEAFARLNIHDHYEIWPLDSSVFDNYLAQIYWHETGKTLSRLSISNVKCTLEAIAKFNSPMIRLYSRTARQNNTFFYDLTNKNWEFIQINQEGWDLVQEETPIFRRFGTEKRQEYPTSSNDWRRIFNYINIPNEDDRLLFYVAIVSYFIPDIPHPILLLHGEQGAAKSTASKMVRSIVDPSSKETLGLPKNEDELVLHLYKNWMLTYDNVTILKQHMADALCRAVTGDAFSKRKLYTNDEESIFTFKNCILLNGINLPNHAPDLLDRSIIIKLSRITEENRKTEKEVWSSFNLQKTLILGNIFDVLSKAMTEIENVSQKKLPRMADFAKWGCAIAKALGYSQEHFLEVYRKNIEVQKEEILNSDATVQAILEFLKIFDAPRWEGTATNLLHGIRMMDSADYTLPRSASHLSKKLNIIQDSLKQLGIKHHTTRGANGMRTIHLELTKSDAGDGAKTETLDKTHF